MSERYILMTSGSIFLDSGNEVGHACGHGMESIEEVVEHIAERLEDQFSQLPEGDFVQFTVVRWGDGEDAEGDEAGPPVSHDAERVLADVEPEGSA